METTAAGVRVEALTLTAMSRGAENTRGPTSKTMVARSPVLQLAHQREGVIQTQTTKCQDLLVVPAAASVWVGWVWVVVG